ncbi:L-seryl-tRNA(Sec) selenium transferase [Desulfovibrio mangrovi]|uniref:L-seryl-tRNA(Sec) selenium transferase n=1 Tax=Desulfovibrio mangrovi TaxID=2976983 RepID=UPI0022450213|nr:L-seryl-tRNA(Sec) selenium transferase [Desulfovibrio mangrovi]UZP69101.1 L-seryl-tRNA(Sec) selenium transferase [Desulfovibrio mangrovi]
MSQLYRALPSVDRALDALANLPLNPSADKGGESLALVPRAILRDHVNGFLDVCREEIRGGVYESPEQLSLEALLPRMAAYVRAKSRPHFRRVLNGTGVVVHTNLGRSLLADTAVEAVCEACAHYSNLEFDLETGERGSRYSHVERILCQVTGAEAGLVVNNNAAAVMLVLDTLCKGREVIVSRGQLVEIGGSFRIPEVMEKSGARLREVGATNRTHLRDYENAITEETAALLRVHTSNYRIVGFHKEVTLEEMVALGKQRGLPVLEDLGSGSFHDFTGMGMGDEPTVQQVVAAGPDVVTFSGDKVLGGPQAGIIVGRKACIDRIKKNPMNRALRIDKMTLAALEATLRLYADPEKARREIPTLAMITAKADELKARARKLAAKVRRELGDLCAVALQEGASRVGGGSFPERDLPTTLVRIAPAKGTATGLKQRLLDTNPPLVGRLEGDAFCLDPRTLTDAEFALVCDALRQALPDSGN